MEQSYIAHAEYPHSWENGRKELRVYCPNTEKNKMDALRYWCDCLPDALTILTNFTRNGWEILSPSVDNGIYYWTLVYHYDEREGTPNIVYS